MKKIKILRVLYTRIGLLKKQKRLMVQYNEFQKIWHNRSFGVSVATHRNTGGYIILLAYDSTWRIILDNWNSSIIIYMEQTIKRRRINMVSRAYWYNKDPNNEGRGAGFYYHRGKNVYSKQDKDLDKKRRSGKIKLTLGTKKATTKFRGNIRRGTSPNNAHFGDRNPRLRY